MVKDSWDNHRDVVLSKSDKSFKQSVDAPVKRIVDIVNSAGDFFTTSSCSGRIMLIHEADSEKRKNGASFLFVSHDVVEPKRSYELLQLCGGLRGNVFLKLEPLIIHIECRNLDLAVALLHRMKEENEFKHTSIVSARGNKFIASIKAVVKLEIPVVFDGVVLLDGDLLEKYLGIANGRMSENFDAIARLEYLLESGMLEQVASLPDSMSDQRLEYGKMGPSVDITCDEIDPATVISLPKVNVSADGAQLIISFNGIDVRVDRDGKFLSLDDSGSRTFIVPDAGSRPTLDDQTKSAAISTDMLVVQGASLWLLIKEHKKGRSPRFMWKRVRGDIPETVGLSGNRLAAIKPGNNPLSIEIKWSVMENKNCLRISKFERYGPVVVIPEFITDTAKLRQYAVNMGCQVVMYRPSPEPLAKPHLLYPDTERIPVFSYKENGAEYILDLECDSFSPLLVAERQRLTHTIDESENILEFAKGVECFAIAILAKCLHVNATIVVSDSRRMELMHASLQGVVDSTRIIVAGSLDPNATDFDRAFVSDPSVSVESIVHAVKHGGRIHHLARSAADTSSFFKLESSRKLKHGYFVHNFVRC